MKYVLLALALCAPLTAAADCATNRMDCTSDSEVRIGSFTDRATDVIGSIIASRLTAVQRLQRREISVSQAQSVQTKADHARAMWEKARTACHAGQDGTCQGDSTKAFALLTSAQKAIQ